MARRRSSNSTTRARRLRPWRNLLIAVLIISVFQYLKDGSVTWPADLLTSIRNTLGDYATRPEAGWREASDQLEELGAQREGIPLPDFDLTGRVVRVADGDTLSILDKHNQQHKIRLHGIDSPEREQPHGKAAWDALEAMVDGKTVSVVVLGEDSYGRTDGTVYLGEQNINLALVANGHAWWYRYYAPNNRLLEATEQQARRDKRGLWADANPKPPWDWRREQRYSRP
ncbi:MAG: thermonuclease family protein [Pseudomonadota bacterium]